MTFLFAYIGDQLGGHGWPVQLMYQTEAALAAVAILCACLAIVARHRVSRIQRTIIAAVGGISAGIGLIMPLELAPFFFDAGGEWMMALIALNLLYPVIVWLIGYGFLKFMTADR